MFNISRRIVFNGVYQGDLLFTSGDKKKQTIDGESMITFTLTQLHMQCIQIHQ